MTRAWSSKLAWAGPLGLALVTSAVVPESEARDRRASAITMPGPSRGPLAAGRVELNAECVHCHEQQARQWEGSLHQRSFIDEGFQTAFARERRAFCRGCHAPEADPSGAPPRAQAKLGVACVTCHVPEGAGLATDAVLAAPGPGRGPSPHPLVRSRAFGEAEACASCHEFRSPRSPIELQTTVAEHRRSALADEPCQSCHMPVRDGFRAHGFPASRDPSVLREAVRASAEREGADGVAVILLPGRVGHAVPTGDLFRRLVVELGVRGDDGFEVLDQRALGRHFARRGGRREQVRDDRLGMPDAPARIRLRAPEPMGAPLRWRVVYERADTTVPGDPLPPLLGHVVVIDEPVPPFVESP